jgi:hypothetical protein
MLKVCVLILPVSDPAKQAVQVVKHHVFDEYVIYRNEDLRPLIWVGMVYREDGSI